MEREGDGKNIVKFGGSFSERKEFAFILLSFWRKHMENVF